MGSVILLFGFLAYTFSETNSFSNDFQQINRSYKLITKMKETVQTIYVCESNVRGYALNHQDALKAEYELLKDSVEHQLQSLRKLTHNTRYQRQIIQMDRMVADKLRLLDLVIAHKSGQQIFKDKEELKAALRQGHQLMSQIHNIEVRMQASEEKLLRPSQVHAESSIQKSFLIIGCAALAGIFITVLMGLIVHQYIQKQRELHNNLVEINEQKNRFFSIVGHDLRGPIHSANTLLNIIRQQDEFLSVEDRHRFMDGAIETITQSTKLLDNLLIWGRSQLNHLSFNPQSLPVKTLADEILTIQAPLAAQKDITLVNEVPDNVFVFADTAMLEMVIRNLVSNAIKFTLPGGRVVIRSVKKNTYTEIQVCDTGIGMPAEVVEQLFKLNSQFTSAGTGGERGTGLGLVLCQEYVQKHKGAIEVQSTLGKGSQFNVRFPVAA